MRRFKISVFLLMLCFLSTGVIQAQEGDVKSPGVALLLSAVLPAGGQYYNGDIAKGLIFDAGIGIGALMMLKGVDATNETLKTWNGFTDGDPNSPLKTQGAVVIIGCYLLSLIDAPASADTYNRKHKKKDSAFQIDLSPLQGQASAGSPGVNVAFNF